MLPPAQTPPDIGRQLKASIGQFTAQTVRPVIETDKTIWNAKVRRNELYYRGLQDLVYTAVPGGRVDYISVSQQTQPNPLNVSASNQLDSLYDYVLNCFQGDVDTFIAVIGARAPNCQSQAKDKSNDDQIRLKLKADRVAEYLESQWDKPTLHTLLVRGLALYGTMFGHTRYTVNKRRYGSTQQPNYSIQSVPQGNAFHRCPWCGAETPADAAQAMAAQTPGMPPNTVPCMKCQKPLGPETLVQPEQMISLVPNGFTDYENGAVELSIYNPAHVTTALWNPCLEKAPWLILETEENKGDLIAAYPELRQNAYLDTYSVGNDMALAMGRYTRELLTSPSGFFIPRIKSQWLHTRIWIAPECYEYLPNDRSGQLRDWLYGQYPDGMMVPMINGEALTGDQQKGWPNRIINEKLTSVWTACKPKQSEMIYADPYFEVMIQTQDTVNDMVSMLIEQAERSNPFVIADPEILSPDSIRQYSSIPGEFKFAKPGSVGSLDKGFFRVPAAEINEVLPNFIDKYIAWTREITGITPSLFGGEQAGSDAMTARQYEIMRNQALMKLNVPWGQIRTFWARTTENGIYQAAKYSGGKLISSNQQGTLETMQIDGIWELAQGGWFMECEESMPESIGQRRDWVMHALTMPPEIQSNVLGVNKPGNIVKIQEAIGMSDWDTPGYGQVIRINTILGKLSNAQPTPGQPGPPGPPDPMTGAPGPPGPPGPPQPSIPFNGQLFDASLAMDIVKEYMLADSRQDMELTNPGGFANIMAYLGQIQQAMPPMGPPPQPMKWTGTMAFSDLTPDMQQAVAHMENIPIQGVPPGMPLAIPKPPPAPPGMHPGGPPPNQPGPVNPPNPLAGTPPPGALPPSDQSAKPPLPDISNMTPPGVLQ